jgi:hypothetical protein
MNHEIEHSPILDCEKHQITFPAFTNEVAVIRPVKFYENREAMKDNLFMHSSELTPEETQIEVNTNNPDDSFSRLTKSSTTSSSL